MFKPYKYNKQIKPSKPKKSLSKKVNLKLKKPKQVKERKFDLNRSIRMTVSSFLIFFGLYFLASNVIFPVVTSYANNERREPIINPLNESDLAYFEEDGNNPQDDFDFVELNNQAQKHSIEDFPTERSSGTLEKNMYLSIPKLDIKDAVVDIDSENMDPRGALGHFKDTCLPGDGCNSFIYGHSAFKYFKNKYLEGDYTAIFSRLDELSYGDEFTIKYKGDEYRYIVDFTRVQSPEEVDPLGNPYPKSLGKHQSTVELFTCTPSGTIKYRLSVVGKLIR